MKKLMILAGMLAALLVAAAPALGQQQEQQEGPYRVGETTITGVISTKEFSNITRPLYVIADEENGVDRIVQTLGPDEGGPDLSQYVGQRVTVTGIPQTLGNPPSDFENFLTDVPVLVSSVEPAGEGAQGDQYDDSEGGQPDAENGGQQPQAAPEQQQPVTGQETLPDTGGPAPLLAAGALILLGSGIAGLSVARRRAR